MPVRLICIDVFLIGIMFYSQSLILFKASCLPFNLWLSTKGEMSTYIFGIYQLSSSILGLIKGFILVTFILYVEMGSSGLIHQFSRWLSVLVSVKRDGWKLVTVWWSFLHFDSCLVALAWLSSVSPCVLHAI